MTGLYWEAKCGRAAAEYNLKKAGMIETISGHVAGQMRDGDNFWDDIRWTLTERGRRAGMADLQRVILSDPPLEIALWDAQDEAADVAGGCGGHLDAGQAERDAAAGRQGAPRQRQQLELGVALVLRVGQRD